MPNTGNYSKAVLDWEQLLSAVQENEGILPDIQAEKDELQQVLDAARSMKVRRESYRAARQQATQDLKALVQKGNEFAMRIRQAAKFKIGPRSERLVQFNAAPLRPRARRTVTVAKPESPAPPPAPTPAE